jgi:predicted enzyme related to lactoylglutathione lyase
MMDLPAEAKANGARPAWLGYVAVDDVDASAAKIVADGGTEHMPPMTLEGVGRMAMLADPQGAMFYIMRGAVDGTSTAFDPQRTGHCHWNELGTTDQSAAWDFYGKQFGWKKGDVMSMGEMGEYQFLDHAGQTIGAFSPCQAPQRPGWLSYFGIEDIDECARRIADGGGQIHFGPSEIPGGFFIIIAADPQGASFGLVGPRKS